MAGAYIDSTSITDTIAKRFVDATDTRVSTWVTRANEQIEMLALSLGVDETDIYTPLHPVIADFGRSVFCEQCFLENIGVNNIETPLDEKYRMKYDLYVDRIKTLRGQITRAMFDTTTADLDPEEVIGGNFFWRA